MAKLVPARSTCLRRMTSGERRFSERLEQKLEDDYLLWYDVPIGLKQRQPDFVILHPRRGLLVLEVKDWKLETIREANRKSFTLLTDRGLVTVINPQQQARVYALEVKIVLEADSAMRHPPGSPHAGQLVMPWGFGVVLTHITRRQFTEAQLDQVIEPHLVLCKDEIVETVDAEALQRRLWSMLPQPFGCVLSLPQIDRVRWLLFPEIRVAPGEGQFGLFDAASQPNVMPLAIPDLVKVMDMQQESLARSLGEGHRIIHGVAGSGKTMILGYRCLHLARMVSKPVLVLCYNTTLAARLGQIVHGYGLAHKVQVHHFHEWCRRMLDAYHVCLPASGERYFDALAPALMRALEQGQVPRAQYSAVLIDEGHDFKSDWYRLVVHMLDPSSNALLVLYDDAQNIYGTPARRGFTWKSVGIEAVGHTTILKLNYRNTLEILSVARHFAEVLLHEQSSDDDGVPLIVPQSSGRHGPVPELFAFRNQRDECKAIVQCIQDALDRGTQPCDIAVLYRTHREGDALAQQLAHAGIAVCVAQTRAGKAALFSDDRCIKLMTQHSSKGLEFPMVIIYGLGQLPHPREDAVHEARLLYVAMTRATERLLLFHHDESAFTMRLDSAIQRTLHARDSAA
ncbi:DEAD/DEAH box helicase [Metallibacterium scheffleri]|uniref:DNA 3'-5' helicase II n=2 Tax=Metallibacterium scheffleri TaxID=993689 RepID=A0A4S3KNY7_9GAMM|nr:3'-5' exonuclease [Metallibacterium scheffleri]THD10695.1 DNA helicase II [Metallibacterium scheffleri]